MCKQKEKWKTVFKAVLTIAMMCYLALNNWQIVLAEEAPEERTEVVAGEIYRFKNSENYDISSADSLSVDNTEKKSYGQFSITGNISTVRFS